MVARLRVARARTATLTITGSPTLTATQNAAYAGFTPSTTGGSGGNMFSMVGTALPAGMSLNSSTGAVTGTPTVSGTVSGIIERVTDSFGHTADLAWGDLVVSISAYDDGLSAAPSGTAQHPHLLDLSSGTNENARTFAVRPSWNVAGVDYAVGYPSGQTFKTLPADAASLPGTVFYDNTAKRMDISGAATLDGWDLDVGGAGLIIYLGTTADITIKNCKWKGYTDGKQFIHDNGATNTGLLTIQYCVIDGNLLADDIIYRYGGGTRRTIIEYCWFKNGRSDAIALQTAFDKMWVRYNLFENFSQGASNHADMMQVYITGAATMTDLRWYGNTIFQKDADAITHLPSEFNSMIRCGGNNTANTLDGFQIHHNTLVGLGNANHLSSTGVDTSGLSTILQGFGDATDSKCRNGEVWANYAWTETGPSFNSGNNAGFKNTPWQMGATPPYMTATTFHDNVRMTDNTALFTITRP